LLRIADENIGDAEVPHHDSSGLSQRGLVSRCRADKRRLTDRAF
jgi:hypothetical protein